MVLGHLRGEHESKVKVSISCRTCVYHQIPGVNKSPQKFIFAYLVFSQKSYLNMWCFEKIHICIPKIQNLHTKPIFRHAFDFFMT